MEFPFKGAPKYTIGTELELQLLDPRTLDLVPRAEAILAHNLPYVVPEVQMSQIEVNSSIYDHVSEAFHDLQDKLKNLHKVTESLEIKLAMSGTHPFQHWPDRLIFPKERYHGVHQRFQWLSKRMNVYGIHIHVGVPNGDKALELSKRIIPFLPHLLALTVSAPYWQSIDTGMQSCRPSIMEAFPYAGIPPIFHDWEHFEHYLTFLFEAEAIESLKDLYWFVRPNMNFGTVEIRMYDAVPTLSQLMPIMAFTHCLVAYLLESECKLEASEHAAAPINLWNAARDGLKANVYREGSKRSILKDIQDLLVILKPFSEDLQCSNELEKIHQILKGPSSSDIQREIFQKRKCIKDIVEHLSRELEEDLFHT